MISRVIVIHPELPYHQAQTLRAPQAKLEEAVGLAAAIDVDIVGAEALIVKNPKPATLFGSGQVERIHALVKTEEAHLVIVDTSLTPVQQRNLEKGWEAKVIDRTALILEIFGKRARTKEGQLQVELASLEYQKSRLVRSWTHLERQRGGFGFLGGPGETQIETDRRMIRDRIAAIKKELEKVVRTRTLHRKTRRDVPYPLVAIVGYTNAGKSTLFNRLTQAHVLAEDMLFATLDPTIRQTRLPSGLQVLLSDTVGFISDLPTELIAAFRATLEEVLEADVLLHVRDITHLDSLAQKNDVETIIAGLYENVPEDERPPVIEVWNKMDLMQHDETDGLPQHAPVPVSALTGYGFDRLLERIERVLTETWLPAETFTLPPDAGKRIAWLYQHGQVLQRENSESGDVQLTVRLTEANKGRFAEMS
ncbi:MAG: GTPase HflX [Rickettsiales bacterium]